jgi:hypothetical protein
MELPACGDVRPMLETKSKPYFLAREQERILHSQRASPGQGEGGKAIWSEIQTEGFPLHLNFSHGEWRYEPPSRDVGAIEACKRDHDATLLLRDGARCRRSTAQECMEGAPDRRAPKPRY